MKYLVLFLLVSSSLQAQEPLNYLAMARSAMEADNYNEANRFLDSAKVQSPKNAQIPLIRASIYTEEGKLREAINSYNEASELDAGISDLYFRRAQLRYDIGDHRNYSLQDIDQAIILDPGNSTYLVKKAFYLSNTQNPTTGLPDLEAAIQALSEAIQLAPDSASYYDLRGQVKFEADQPLSAIADFTKAIDLAPQIAIFWNDRGLSYLLLEDYQAAISDFTKAIELDPLNQSFLQKRGHARFNNGDFNQAIDDFTLAINTIFRKVSMIPGRIDTDHPLNKELQENYLFRGSALLQVDASHEACNDFKSARELGNRRAGNYVSRYCR